MAFSAKPLVFLPFLDPAPSDIRLHVLKHSDCWHAEQESQTVPMNTL